MMKNGCTPLDRLASLSVLETFGDTVQRVGDVLMGRDELTLSQLVAFVKESAKQSPPHLSCGGGGIGTVDFDDEDEDEDSSRVHERRPRLGVVVHGKRRPKPWDRTTVRAALVVLMQHGVVSARKSAGALVVMPSSSSKAKQRPPAPPRHVYHYRFEREPALRLLRCAKYVEFFKRVVLVGDEVTSSALQCLLVAGRLRTCDWILDVVSKQTIVDPRYTAREQAVEAAYKLESLGFVVPVQPAFGDDAGRGIDGHEDDDEGEFEFEGSERRPSKKVRLDKTAIDASRPKSPVVDEDPIVVAILNGSAHYKNSLLPVDTVWTVNVPMLHAYQRAYQLGRLVAERYGHKVQSCGSLVTAALKYRAQAQHNPNERASTTTTTNNAAGLDASVTYLSTTLSFSVMDIIKYVPKAVLQILEKKPGGLHMNLAKAFDDLVLVAEYPAVIRPSRAAMNAAVAAVDSDIPQSRYEIHVRSLTRYLQERIIHQIVSDRHGVVASRVISILWTLGYVEAETIAEHAMVPVKEAREVLHCLYKSSYVDLLQLSTSGTGGGGGGSSSRLTTASFGTYNSAVYLWGIRKLRLKSQVLDNVAKAYVNVRLRRRHELDVGRQWIQRAQQADDTDENDHENDRLNYTKFCLGLERLDVAALQLDDTLLALNDFC